VTPQPKILVLDSETAGRLATTVKLLTRWEVVYAPDFGAVVEAIKSRDFDLLVLDLCDSYCRDLAYEFHSRFSGKVLFLTRGEDMHSYFLPTGTEVVLTKPIDAQEFVCKVAELLGETVQ